MIRLLVILNIFFNIVLAQQINDDVKTRFSDFQISSEKYMTDEKGNILMYVNVWGEVKSPGHHLVYEGIDLGTLLSMVGGTVIGANLKKVRIHREVPDDNGQVSYKVDLQGFIMEGDRSNFIKIKPNDTIFIPSSPATLILRQIGSINTILSMISIYLALQTNN